MAYIRNDDIHIGGMGARYLVSLGNRRSYGFIPTVSHQYWSADRYAGFKQELAKRGLECAFFRSPAPAGSHEDFSALKAWLMSLPKPCAVMAAWDTRATQAIQMCTEAHVKIPDQLALLGVDNDELLDESTTPPLSSILPDHEKLGYVAARALESLMRGGRHATDVVFRARPKQLVERESANASAPAAHLITRAMSFINRNATKGITVDDVVTFLGVSRRLADLRFHQFAGETINAAIVRVRLDAVKKLLATTNRPIHTISEACGYSDLAYLKKLFKQRFGVTMREWRKRS
jgi:LacI family transcriptional regulator